MNNRHNNPLGAAPPGGSREFQLMPIGEPIPSGGEGNPNAFALRGNGAYLTPDSRLLLTAYNVTSGLVLRVSGIVQTLDGEFSQFQRDFSIAATGAEVLNAFFVGVGYLQSIYVSVQSGSPGYNDVYAEVGILKGSTVTRTGQVAILLAGNISSTRSLGQTQPSGINTNLGTPSVYSVNGTPAPSFTFTVPTGKQVIIRAIHVIWLTDATAGNRLIRLQVNSVSASGGYYCPYFTQPASTAYYYVFAPDLIDSTAPLQDPATATNYYIKTGFPALHLTAADTIVCYPINKLGTDSGTFTVHYDVFSL